MKYVAIENTTHLDRTSKDHIIVEKIFQQEGEAFPLLTLSLFKNEDGGVDVSINKKESARGYWEACSLPKELIPTMIELLEGLPKE